MTTSLPRQIAALRHCISLADADERVREDAEAGLKSLEWLDRNTEIIREVARLMKETPFVIEILREFPGAQIKASEVSNVHHEVQSP